MMYDMYKLIWLGNRKAILHLERWEIISPLVISKEGDTWKIRGKVIEIASLLKALKKTSIELTETQLENFLLTGCTEKRPN